MPAFQDHLVLAMHDKLDDEYLDIHPIPTQEGTVHLQM